MEKSGIGEEFERDAEHRMTMSQAVGLGVLSFFVLGAIGLGLFGTVKNIKSPFERKYSSSDSTYLNAALESLKKQNDPEYQKTIDTDGDGLNDYDEINLYRSSQYLKDTNGDGIDDKASIAKGIDPTCLGDCSIGTAKDGSKDSSQAGSRTVSAAQGQELLNKQIEELKKMTPAQIREQLIKKGVPKEKLDAIADDKLLELFQRSFEQALKMTPIPEALKNNQEESAAFLPSSPTQLQNNPADFANMMPSEIRKILLSTGKVTEAQLSQIDDATLKEYFSKKIQELQKQNPELNK